jgi:hypothetical protein
MKYIIYICVALISLSKSLLAQNIYTIPDPQFASCLKSQIAQAFVSNTQFNTSIAVQYKGTIDCSSKQIKSIDGLQYFTNATAINISGNQIDTLGSIYNTTFNSLTIFNCSSNNISALYPLSHSPNVANLNCGLNRITSLNEIASLAALSSLDCKNNLIEEIATFHPNAALNFIDARNNKINELPYLSLTNYKSLKNGGAFYLGNNNLGFQQLDNSLKNIVEPNPIDRFTIFDFNSQNTIPFNNSAVVEFEIGDTLTLKLNYTPYTGDRFIWRHNNYLLSNASATLTKTLTIADTGEYYCEIQNINVIPYSGLTISSTKIKLKLKVITCPDIRNVQTIIKPNVCLNKNEIVVKGYAAGYVYALENAFKLGSKISTFDSTFKNIGEGTYKLTVNNFNGNCIINSLNYQYITVKNVKALDFIPTTYLENCSNKGEVSVLNYNPLYTYKLINNATSISTLASQGKFTNLIDGNYSFVVGNMQLTCFDTLKTSSINILSLNADNFKIKTNDVSCEGKGEAFISNYNPLYIYKLYHVATKIQVAAVLEKFTNLTDGDYKLFVEKPGACIDTSDSVVLTIKSLKAKDFILTSTEANCKGKGEIEIQNYSTTNSFLLYNISGQVYEPSNALFTNLPDNTYTLVVYNVSTACRDTNTLQTYKIKSVAASDFNLNTIDATCFDDGKVEINANYNANYLYFLTNITTGNTVNAQQGVFNNLKPGEYLFSINNQLGTCKDTLKTNHVSVKSVGNCGTEVTPNGDGINDNLTITEIGASKIFDRNGVLIAELMTPAEWDCKNKAAQFVTSGIYALYVNDVFVKMITVFK